MSGGGRRPPFGGFFSGFNDPFFSGAFEGFHRFDSMMSSMFSDAHGSQGGGQRQARQPSSSTAREIPIAGPDDEDAEEPTVPHRLTGPLIHELPNHEDLRLHPDLMPDTASHPDTVQEPEDHSARPYQHYHPPEEQPTWQPPPQQQQQYQQYQQYSQPHPHSQAQAADPLAAMGTGPPPSFAPYPQPPPLHPPPPRPPPAVRTSGGVATSALEADEPGSPLLVHLADGMVISDESPRHFQYSPASQHVPTAGREAGVAPWPPSGHSTGQQGCLQHQQQQQQYQQQQQADWLTGTPAAPASAPPPPHPQLHQQGLPRRRSAAAPLLADEHGAGLFVRTPTSQTPAGALFGSPPEHSPAGGATAAGPVLEPPVGRAPAGIRSAEPGSPPDLIDRTGPDPSSSNGGNGDSQQAGTAPPAAEPLGGNVPTGLGRRQRRPSSRSPASQQAQAAAADLAAQQARRHRERGRPVRRRSGWPGGSDAEVEEGGEGTPLAGLPGGEEDPEWQPRPQGPPPRPLPSGTPPASKRTRRGGGGDGG